MSVYTCEQILRGGCEFVYKTMLIHNEVYFKLNEYVLEEMDNQNVISQYTHESASDCRHVITFKDISIS